MLAIPRTFGSSRNGNRAGALVLGFASVQPVVAQESASGPRVTGVLGSPSATTTIDGKQLPPLPPKFGDACAQY